MRLTARRVDVRIWALNFKTLSMGSPLLVPTLAALLTSGTAEALNFRTVCQNGDIACLSDAVEQCTHDTLKLSSQNPGVVDAKKQVPSVKLEEYIRRNFSFPVFGTCFGSEDKDNYNSCVLFRENGLGRVFELVILNQGQVCFTSRVLPDDSSDFVVNKCDDSPRDSVLYLPTNASMVFRTFLLHCNDRLEAYERAVIDNTETFLGGVAAQCFPNEKADVLADFQSNGLSMRIALPRIPSDMSEAERCVSNAVKPYAGSRICVYDDDAELRGAPRYITETVLDASDKASIVVRCQ
jgi:hypothetical protein